MASLSGRIASDQEPLYDSMNTATNSSLTPHSNTNATPAAPPVLTSISSSQAAAPLNDSNNNNTGAASILSQSAHPGALVFLYLFRSAAVATYLFCGFVSSSYVFSTVLVVVLLSLDFWTVRNVSGRRLVGLRFWSQVDEDGTAFWVFESRSVSTLHRGVDSRKSRLVADSNVRIPQPDQVANVIDAKMFWIALYTFPVIWIALFFVGLLKFNLSFLPIVALALVFNLTNAVGYTYDAKRRWATGVGMSGLLGSVGGLGGSMVTGLASNAFSRLFK
ncbi:BQ5605_C015g07778 [Microbotryum silenes-dioicae]|uniref:Golgi apparatus membrane protein TVP23 n=1 Tax=Microbotryum silenes-dioicae TaxID=796604 RepID=A0A2X0LWK2_9BASI|nr:BQ5605_C015g07778 [Microbotryum silenes-dioicae]